ncbi:MAG: N-acetyltransferase [Bacteroidales bacterium]|nr:N-acetyltransferase [Bacteroidales bacterium]
MIRNVKASDASAIVEIYNEYILNTTISFEMEPLSVEQMRQRIEDISAHCPYLVWEEDDEIAGYCYAHPWKERAAYHNTLETTIYLSPRHFLKGIGTKLMKQLIEDCRQAGFKVLIACITANNEVSIEMHRRLGFKKVSHFEQVGEKLDQLLDVIDMQLIL